MSSSRVVKFLPCRKIIQITLMLRQRTCHYLFLFLKLKQYAIIDTLHFKDSEINHNNVQRNWYIVEEPKYGHPPRYNYWHRMSTDQWAVPVNYRCRPRPPSNVIISHRWTQFDVWIFPRSATFTIFAQIFWFGNLYIVLKFTRWRELILCDNNSSTSNVWNSIDLKVTRLWKLLAVENNSLTSNFLNNLHDLELYSIALYLSNIGHANTCKA